MIGQLRIPDHWRWATFGDVADVASDLVDPTLTPNAIHIAPNHIESWTGRLLPFATVAADGVKSPKQRFFEGQILYSKIRPYLAKATLAAFDGLCSADMYPVAAKINPKFLLHWILTPWFTGETARNQGRTILPKINRDALDRMPVPVAPLREQEQIATKIEELFSDLDAGVAALERAKANLKRYQASVLKAAVDGSLTAEWRAKQLRQDAGATVEAASRRCHASQNSQPTVELRHAASAHELNYFNKNAAITSLRGNLPHWRQEGVVYFVTFRLGDSIPRSKIELWQRQREDWLRRHPLPHTDSQKKEYSRLFVHRIEKWLDAGSGECLLAQPAIRQIVVGALRQFDGQRYLLHEWVVMPNHVHALLSPLAGHELSQILHSWKSYTAKRINAAGRRDGQGQVWQKESFDHIVRSPEEFERIVKYIRKNPAGLAPGSYCAGTEASVEAASRRFSEDVRGDETEPDRPTDVENRLRQDAGATYEPASKLLERILQERRRKWEADQLAKFAAAGKEPLKSWQSKYIEPTPPDTANLSDLPEGWCWASVNQLLAEPTCNGISVKGRNEPPGIAALRLSAMTDCGSDYSERRFIDIPEETAKNLAVRQSDFFVSRGNGSLHLVGRGTLAQEPNGLVVFPDTMIRLRLVQTPLPEYLNAIWPSLLMRRQIEKKARTTAGIYKVSQRDVEAFIVPMPPLDEQLQIVTEAAEKLSQIEAADQAIGHGLLRAARLRQSILKQAFEGKLVPQDPSDEPASVLLEQIGMASPTHNENRQKQIRQSRRAKQETT